MADANSGAGFVLVISAVSFAVALVTARLFTPALIASLRQAGCVVENYRGAEVPRPAGLGLVLGACAGAMAGAVAGALAYTQAAEAVAAWAGGEAGGAVALLGVIALCLGMAAAGILDDLAGSAESRGFAGHLRALAGRRLTTGAVKIIVAAMVCGSVAWARHLAPRLAENSAGGHWPAVAVAIAVLATDVLALAASANAINLLDTKPGRAVKGALLLLAGIVAAGGGLWPAAVAAGATMGYVRFDLSEQGMLGDAGANPLGALVGLAALELKAMRLGLFLAVVIGVNIASEFTSLGKLIESSPPLAAIDRLGRRSAG